MASFYADINSIPTEDHSSSPRSKTSSLNTAEKSSVLPQDDSSDNESTSSSDSKESLAYNDEFLRTIEDSDDVTGVKCQAPFKTDWTGRQFHNAMIMSVIGSDDSDIQDSINVKVLFLNPTLEKMKPCPYFLDEKCRYWYLNCSFSESKQQFLNRSNSRI